MPGTLAARNNKAAGQVGSRRNRLSRKNPFSLVDQVIQCNDGDQVFLFFFFFLQKIALVTKLLFDFV